MKRIFIVAGEASSDIHASNLIKVIHKHSNEELEFTGIGGERMLATGLFSPEYLNKDFAVCGGLSEIWSKLFFIFRAYKDIKNRAKLGAYDLVILLDYPEFNLRLAKYFTKISVPVIYYITPQVWAWRSYRVKQLKKYCRELICVFDFEKTFFKEHGVDVNFVGHPLVDEINAYSFDKNLLKQKYAISDAISDGVKVITIMPGSRESEINNLLPEILKSLTIINDKIPNVKFFLPLANTIEKSFIEKFIFESEIKVELVKGNTYEILSISDYAITASGTASLECALFKIPMTILYKVGSLSFFIFKYFIRYNKPIGLPNLLIQEPLFTELLQKEVDKNKIAIDVLNNLDPEVYKKFEPSFKKINNAVMLTNKSPSYCVFELIKKYLSY